MIGAIIHALADKGPMTGAELEAAIGTQDHFELWYQCFSSETLQISSFAHYYLRFDVTRGNLLRLSPSILRDFLTYTLIGLPHHRHEMHRRQLVLSNAHREISHQKLRIAMNILAEVEQEISEPSRLAMCAFVGGDIAYFMSHAEERPSSSTGENMSGSDIDIVVVYGPSADESDLDLLDKHLTQRKVQFMRDSRHRQELDFIIKPIDRVVSQTAYSTIDQKIACKIIAESMFAWGSTSLYMRLRHLLDQYEVSGKIHQDFQEAITERASAVDVLLHNHPKEISEQVKGLFYFSQERVEFS